MTISKRLISLEFKTKGNEKLNLCLCDPGHICDGHRGHNVDGCPENCPVHREQYRRKVLGKYYVQKS